MSDKLDDFNKLSRDEQSAFLAWFAGGLSVVMKIEGRDPVFMGKCECEWVPFQEFWLEKMPALGWFTVTEERRFTAVGIVGQPGGIEYKLTATDKGWEVREAYWNRFKQRIAEQE